MKMGKVLQTGIKHCGKRKNCSLLAISPFTTVFSKGLHCRHIKTRACLGKGKSCENFAMYNALERCMNPLRDDKILASSKSKAFADNNFYVAQTVKFLFKKVENLVGRRENDGLQMFATF